MLNFNKSDLVYLLLTLDRDDEDYVVNNFVGDAWDVLGVLTELTECVPVELDCIQFDSEDEEGYYCISVEKSENNDSAVLVGVVNAMNELNGKFYGINGNVLVADYVIDSFEKDIKSYHQTNLGYVIRVNYCDSSCDDCVNNHCDDEEIYTEKDDNFITQAWTDGYGNYFSHSFSSTDPKMMELISKEWSDFETRFRKG